MDISPAARNNVEVNLSVTTVAISDGLSNGALPKLVKIKHLNTVKLDQDNFYTWESHVMTLLRGYDLDQYVKPSFVLSMELMIRQDQLLLGWIFTSLALGILSQVVGSKSAVAA